MAQIQKVFDIWIYDFENCLEFRALCGFVVKFFPELTPIYNHEDHEEPED